MVRQPFFCTKHTRPPQIPRRCAHHLVGILTHMSGAFSAPSRSLLGFPMAGFRQKRSDPCIQCRAASFLRAPLFRRTYVLFSSVRVLSSPRVQRQDGGILFFRIYYTFHTDICKAPLIASVDKDARACVFSRTKRQDLVTRQYPPSPSSILPGRMERRFLPIRILPAPRSSHGRLD